MAQFAGLGLGVAAVALWALDVPGLSRAMPSKPAPMSGLSGADQPVVTPVAMIAREAPLGIAERLDMAANRPAKPVEEGTKPAAPAPAAPPSTGSPWKYLGPIIEPKRTLAVVSIEGKQRIVSEGMTVTVKTPEAEGRPESVSYRASVKTVTPEYLEIEEEDGTIRKVELEARTAKVAWVKNMPTTVAGAPTAMANAGLSAEAKQRLIAQGIDPQQIERARLAAAQASLAAGRNRASPGPEGNPMGAAPTVVTTGGRAVDLRAVPDAAATGVNGTRQRIDADVDASRAKPRASDTGVIN